MTSDEHLSADLLSRFLRSGRSHISKTRQAKRGISILIVLFLVMLGSAQACTATDLERQVEPAGVAGLYPRGVPGFDLVAAGLVLWSSFPIDLAPATF